MAVIVNQHESIDVALSRLLREVLREGIFKVARKNMYFIAPGQQIRDKRREYKKRKRRYRMWKRRMAKKMPWVVYGVKVKKSF